MKTGGLLIIETVVDAVDERKVSVITYSNRYVPLSAKDVGVMLI